MTEQELVLTKRAERRDLRFGVIGLGYVGLPLTIEIGRANMNVLGFDVSRTVVDGLRAGRSHIRDVASADLANLIDAGRFTCTTDPRGLASCDVISICVPTPLNTSKTPDLSYVIAAAETVAATARAGQLIVLESTTYPGTTREVIVPRLEARGLVVGIDVFVCFSPERVDPGNAQFHTKNTPKVLGGMTPACARVGEFIYGMFIDRIVRVSSPEAAELTKLVENSFRMINIAFANEIALICDRLGLDVWEVLNAAATKPFGFMKFTPGPGVGGHCIPLDPHYLTWKMRTLAFQPRLIDAADLINSAMPAYWVRRLHDALDATGRSLKGAHVLVLGVAYKKDIDDLRESPALEILALLSRAGARISYHDPHCPEIKADGHVPDEIAGRSIALTDSALATADAVLIATDHSGIDYARVAEIAQILVDTRNCTGRSWVRPPVAMPNGVPAPLDGLPSVPAV